MRLDRYLCHATTLSRSLAVRAIRAGSVVVDGEVERDPTRHISPQSSAVTLDGQPLALSGPRYFMLHKPAGYICATQDGTHPTVLDLIDEPQRSGLHIAGRLDLDTTGLVLISDDGQWSHRITSPRRHCAKRYRVTLADDLQNDVAQRFAAGIQLKGEEKPTRPAQLEVVSSRQVLLTIHEGKYHQVKRMFAAVGNHVLALHRVSIGALQLDAMLEPGKYRALSPEEIDLV